MPGTGVSGEGVYGLPKGQRLGEYLSLLRGATQSINDSTFTRISWDLKSDDSGNMIDLAVTPDRIRIPRDGLWLFSGFVSFAANATGFREALISEFTIPPDAGGGALGDYGRSSSTTAGTGVSTALSVTMLRPVRASIDTFYNIRVRHTAGVAINIDLARLTAVRLAPFRP